MLVEWMNQCAFLKSGRCCCNPCTCCTEVDFEIELLVCFLFVFGEYWYQFRPLSIAGSTRESQHPWYSMEKRRRCLSPTGPLAVATPSFSAVDGVLFTVQWSGNLPYRPASEEAAHLAESDGSVGYFSPPDHVSRFVSHIENSPYFRRLVGPFTAPSELEFLTLSESLSKGELLGCSDGSFSKGSGTGSHAWVFATNDETILFKGAGPIDCHPDLLSSYRPEVGGLLVLLFIIHSLVGTFELTEGAVVVYCDNKSALENVFNKDLKRGIYPLLQPDYDLLQLARALHSTLPVTVTGTWVKGHYRGNQSLVHHDLNSLVDFMADQFRRRPPVEYRPSARPLPHPSHWALVFSDGSAITSKLRQVVYNNFFVSYLQETICKRNKWSASMFRGVDRHAFGLAFKTYSKFRQIGGLSKLTHRLWHTGA